MHRQADRQGQRQTNALSQTHRQTETKTETGNIVIRYVRATLFQLANVHRFEPQDVAIDIATLDQLSAVATLARHEFVSQKPWTPTSKQQESWQIPENNEMIGRVGTVAKDNVVAGYVWLLLERKEPALSEDQSHGSGGHAKKVPSPFYKVRENR